MSFLNYYHSEVSNIIHGNKGQNSYQISSPFIFKTSIHPIIHHIFTDHQCILSLGGPEALPTLRRLGGELALFCEVASI